AYDIFLQIHVDYIMALFVDNPSEKLFSQYMA
ncbi:hypothetical protein SAMN05192553_1081, partial [Cyclobacterium xiamenense]